MSYVRAMSVQRIGNEDAPATLVLGVNGEGMLLIANDDTSALAWEHAANFRLIDPNFTVDESSFSGKFARALTAQ